jgi:hypothetical protein
MLPDSRAAAVCSHMRVESFSLNSCWGGVCMATDRLFFVGHGNILSGRVVGCSTDDDAIAVATHPRNVSAVQPISAAIEPIAAHCEA